MKELDINEQQCEYKNVEAATLIIDFTDYSGKNDKILLSQNTINNAVTGIQDIGIENIIVKCTNWLLLKKVVERIKHIVNINITCRIPIYKIPEDITIFKKGIQSVKMSLEIPEVITMDYEIEKYIKIAHKLIQMLSFGNENNVSVVLPVNKDNVENASDIAFNLFRRTGLTIVLSPDVNALNNKPTPSSISWQELDLLYCRIIDILRKQSQNDAILMDLGFLPTRLLIEHPCNGYVCAGCNCHSNKTNLPRRLILTPDGTVLPESKYINRNLMLGNAKKEGLHNIITHYLNSENHNHFMNLAKDVYIKWVQTCPFRVVPWAILVADLSNEKPFKTKALKNEMD
jgi:hypothetical protein